MSLHPDVSQHYALKAAIEQLLGHQAWLDLKECTSLGKWRIHILQLIDAMQISIEESIEIRDQTWMDAITGNLQRGRTSAKSSKDIDELISGFTAMLLRQVFLQIGLLPNRPSERRVTLRRENWRLNIHRSVQYIQSPAQIEAEFWSVQQHEISFEQQMKLHSDYRSSKSKLSFSQWCHHQQA